MLSGRNCGDEVRLNLGFLSDGGESRPKGELEIIYTIHQTLTDGNISL